MRRLLLAVPAALALAGCGSQQAAEPAPGEIAELTEKLDRRAAADKATAAREADDRAADRADRAVERIAASGRERRRAD